MTGGQAVVGVLHPGSMGAAVAAQVRATGATVLWCSAGRGASTRQRAAEVGLTEVSGLGELVGRSQILLSICPPAAAEAVANEVAAHGFKDGVYVEANAITPGRVGRIAAVLPDATVVDGSVIGSPPRDGKRPRLFLSGPGDAADQVVKLFAATDVQARVLGTELGQASALKLAYTSYQKASRVLAALSYALAADHGVEDELLEVAAGRSGSYLLETGYIAKTAARAWRWGPELIEAAELLEECGLPGDPMRGAADALVRWEGERDAELGLAEALARLHSSR
ncbi:phosphogluconate dehydrogenase [Streptomyces tateyamensis]|uniref:Phosphogluconate dehydrogenase n=2 Tax=Streptomyces tateyamensis TaxID=565073 RepID=A0A2V4PM40_9ACTN|nr:phosphogluconate dehydrogenase [Streptomyces tateyamensis]